MGCQLLRPCLGPAARDGPGRDRPPRPPGRRARARRRLRHRPRHRSCSAASRAAPVIAVDGSAAMVERDPRASATRSTAFASDLLELELDEPVDAILSTATFHWIADHERLFARLHAALKPGGRLRRPVRRRGQHRQRPGRDRRRRPARLRGWAGPWNYATPEATAERLRAAGFTDVWTWLQPWPVEPADPHEYFTTVILGSHLERLPDGRARRRSSTPCSAHMDEPGARQLRAAQHPGKALSTCLDALLDASAHLDPGRRCRRSRKRSVIQPRRCSPSRRPSCTNGMSSLVRTRQRVGARRGDRLDRRRRAAHVALLPDAGGERVGVADEHRAATRAARSSSRCWRRAITSKSASVHDVRQPARLGHRAARPRAPRPCRAARPGRAPASSSRSTPRR